MEKKETELIFWIGFVFSAFGIVFNIWYIGIFGLIAMITARWIEKDGEKKNE